MPGEDADIKEIIRWDSKAHWNSDMSHSQTKLGHLAPDVKVPQGEQLSVYPNCWAYYREMIREYAAEFFGTMILIIFGCGVNCQVTLSSNTDVAGSQKGEYLSISFGWAVGVGVGVWICGGISGGHINPAITLALATWRGFPWRKVPGYISSQIFGAFIGAAIVYGNYFHAIDIYEGGRGIRTLKTAGLFGTYALNYMTAASCFFDEFLSTAILLIVVLAINDKRNTPPPAGLAPLALFILVLGIGAAFGMQTGYAVNPARDFGPRLLTSMVGYGRQVYSFRSQYWLWCPFIATILGAQFGCMIYDVFLFLGDESPVNKPDAYARARREKRDAGVDRQV